MKTILLGLLIGLALVVVIAASDVTGNWEVEAKFDDSNLAGGGFDCAFKQDGERFTGKCSGGAADVTGEVKGQKVTWTAGKPPEPPTLTFTGTLDQTATRIDGRFMIAEKGGSFSAIKQ